MIIKRRSARVSNTRAATIRDVAVLAGVSTATVSRVISKPEVVAPHTREKVQAAIKKAGLVLNVTAQALRSKRSKTVLICAGDLSNPFNGEVVEGALQTAERHGYSVIVNSGEGIHPTDIIRDHLGSHQVDGIILLWTPIYENVEDVRIAREFNMPPIVGVRQGKRIPSYPHVTLDNELAAFEIAQYALLLGHSEFCVVAAYPEGEAGSARIAGFRKALSQAGLYLADKDIILADFSIEGGRAAAREIWVRSSKPTVALCTNDLLAVGLLAELRTMRIAVPETIGVTGFDDLAMVDCLAPALTTVRQPRRQIGATCVAKLLHLIEARETEFSTPLDMPVIVRASVLQNANAACAQ